MTREEIRARFAAVNEEIDEIEAFIAEKRQLIAAGRPFDAEKAQAYERRSRELLTIIRELRVESALERATRPNAPRA